MKNSEILAEARESIANRREYRICLALLMCRGGDAKQRQRLVRWVAKLLEGHGTLESWLNLNSQSFRMARVDTPPKTFFLQALNTRLAWMDWMITYWQERGK